MTAHHPSTPGVRFKDIPGFPDYCAGDDGSVWSRKGSHSLHWVAGIWRKVRVYFAGHRNQSRAVVLYARGKSHKLFVGRLVLTAFVGPCPPGMECCHNDGDPDNNRVENLRWDTHKANAADSKRHGTHPMGERSPHAKLTDDAVRQMFRMHASGVAKREIARRFGVDGARVIRILRGERWGHIYRELCGSRREPA